MIRIMPVEPALPVDEQEWRGAPHPLRRAGRDVSAPQDTFSASFLGRRSQQLDPDAGALDEDLPRCELEIGHLLQMLEERLASMRERVLLSAGHVPYGLMQELWQVEEVLCRMVPMWLQCTRPTWRALCRPRVAALFGICHFLLAAMARSGEPHEWRALQLALRRREQELN